MRRTFNLHTLINKLLALSLAALLITGTTLTTNAQINCRDSMMPCATCATPAEDMVAWWTGNNTAEDVQGSNHGTLHNGTRFTTKGAKVGGAFEFDGIDDFVKVPASPALNVGAGDGFTIEAWINPDTDNSVARPLVEWNSSDAGGLTFGVHLWINETYNGVGGQGAIYANIVDASGGFHFVGSDTGVIQPNTYQHVALTYDKSSGLASIFLNGEQLDIYLNGESTGETADIGSFTPQTSSDLYLGHRTGRPHFSGAMDEVSIYDHALTGTDINSIYRADSAGKCRYSVSGRITDECGVALPNINVEVQPLGGAFTRSTLTDALGNYSLNDLPAGGSYTVTPQVPVGSFGRFVPPDSTFINLSTNQTAIFYFRPMMPGKCQLPRPIQYLSDMDWVGTPINPYEPVHRDLSIGNGNGHAGNPITLNGVAYGKGLGVHAYSVVTYNLGGQYSSFVSDIGLDDEVVAGIGSVRFFVLADGQQIYDSDVMRSDTATQTINVSVAGVQELKLIVTIADNGDTADHADWANARLVR
jgi:hypothetical protein